MGLKRAAVRTERVSVLDGFEGRDCGTQKFGGKNCLFCNSDLILFFNKFLVLILEKIQLHIKMSSKEFR